jgi:hypothetical protein
VTGEEVEDLLPAVHGLLGTVHREVVVEEGVAGPVVPVELVVLAVPLELRLVLVDLGRRRMGVVVTEQAEQRGGQVDGRSSTTCASSIDVGRARSVRMAGRRER